MNGFGFFLATVAVASLLLFGFSKWVLSRAMRPPEPFTTKPTVYYAPEFNAPHFDTTAKIKEIFKMIIDFDDIIEDAAKFFDLDPRLLKAVIKVESNFKKNAHRHEPYVGHLNGPDNSFGLMQVLESTARSMGYTGPAYELYHPTVNIHYGAKYLRWQLDRYRGDVNKAIAAYNAGSAWRYSTGDFYNQGYVDKVHEAMEEF